MTGTRPGKDGKIGSHEITDLPRRDQCQRARENGYEVGIGGRFREIADACRETTAKPGSLRQETGA